MIRPNFFVDKLRELEIDFFAGVPDSLLKNICAYISDTVDAKHNIITANEGGAIGLATGYHLASGKIGCVYMQNSGQGNIINPLASLTDKEVYNIPVLIVIGWRGRPGEHDEPQHIKQGKITTGLLNTMGINYDILSKDENNASKQIEKAVNYMKSTKEVYALIIEKDTFDSYSLQNTDSNNYSMTREDAIKIIASSAGNKDVVVGTTGMISRELFEYREEIKENHSRDFLTVGAMGHASQIALGIAMEKQDRFVWCFDGDGALLMHMGSMAIIANQAPKNFIHIVLNNGAHDSVGGQPTVGHKIDIPAIARAVGYRTATSVFTECDIINVLTSIKELEGPHLLEIRVKKGNRNNLGRPTSSPIQNKESIMEFLNS